jgi:hypothetical protein
MRPGKGPINTQVNVDWSTGMIHRSLTFVLVVANAVAACAVPSPEPDRIAAVDSTVDGSKTLEEPQPSGCPSGDPQGLPRIDVVGEGVKLVLPPAMAKVLETNAPGFVPRSLASFDRRIMEDVDFGCDNQPSAILADLNGDGELDLATLGQTEFAAMLVILLSDDGEHRYLERDKRILDRANAEAPDANYFIHLVEPGRYTTRYEPEDPDINLSDGSLHVLHLTHAAIGWGYLEKAAGILYWRNTRFWEFATAD